MIGCLLYTSEHLVDSLEGDFYTFDMFYQSQEHYQTMVEIFKEDLIINDHGGMGSDVYKRQIPICFLKITISPPCHLSKS